MAEADRGRPGWIGKGQGGWEDQTRGPGQT